MWEECECVPIISGPQRRDDRVVAQRVNVADVAPIIIGGSSLDHLVVRLTSESTSHTVQIVLVVGMFARNQ